MAQQTIRIKCPSLTCQKILAVPVTSRGKTVRCKSCGGTIRVPPKAVEPPPEATEAAKTDVK
ncbi:MAG: hypothetical protein H7210_08965 [Pyrinomonadaceae bacterium]|nr:hypothetical protein [Phycisphaerales bacterium]